MNYEEEKRTAHIKSLEQDCLRMANEIAELKPLKKKYSKLLESHVELLSAFTALEDFMNNHYGDDPDEKPLLNAAFAAIRKAESI